jgi:hypothetical protein
MIYAIAVPPCPSAMPTFNDGADGMPTGMHNSAWDIIKLGNFANVIVIYH